MASPVKTAPPTALDRGDRFGAGESSLAAPGLPMPGLSGRANSPTDAHPQATSSRAPSTTRESSRTPRSWLASNLTSRPKCTSPPASAATSSWGFTKCAFHRQQQPQQQHVSAASHNNKHNNDHNNNNNALIGGLFFLGGSNDDKGGEFRYGNNIRVRLQTSSQGFVLGAGRDSVSILRITLRFTIDFLNGEDKDFGLGTKNEGTETKRDGIGAHGKRDEEENDSGGDGKQGGGIGGRPAGDLDGQHSLSLSLTMTITIMAVNSATLS
ncbi:hypothetical protein F4859DRAFT_444808 [Xylaria cf. heliscus]|nr:hypothetical protein F4859DRAFT_444808 [Xylaria cf. heliscus]